MIPIIGIAALLFVMYVFVTGYGDDKEAKVQLLWVFLVFLAFALLLAITGGG